jgi:cytochrome c oxidase subunit 3
MRASSASEPLGGAAGVLTPPRRLTRPVDRPRRARRIRGLSDGNGGGGSGGSGGDGGRPDGEPRRPDGTTELALRLVLVGIATLFLVCIVTCLALRRSEAQRELELPRSLWLSTAFLVAASWALARAARRGPIVPRAALLRGLSLALLLGTAFVGAQALLWRDLFFDGVLRYGESFYLLTGLHGLHVLAGLVLLAVQLGRALFDRASNVSVRATRWCATYWHAMGVIWIALFCVLWLVR